VVLEEAGGNGGRDRAFDGLGDDRGLVLAEGHEDDPPAARMVPTPMVMARRGTFSSPKKVAGGVEPGDAVERDQAGAAVRGEPGSLKPMCPVRPMPSSCRSMPAGVADACS
jgi:hypothetical protein